MSAAGLIGQMLLGGAAGYGEAGLKKIQADAAAAREDGLIRLEARLKKEGYQYQADRADELEAQRHANDMELKASGTPAEIQRLEWLKKEGLLDAAFGGKGGKGADGVTEEDISKSYAKYLSDWDYMNGEPMSRDQYKQQVWGIGSSSPSAPTFDPQTIDMMAGILTSNVNKSPDSAKQFMSELAGKFGPENAQAVGSRAVQMQDGESLRSAVEHGTFKPTGKPTDTVLSPGASGFLSRVMNGGSGVSTTEFGRTRPTAQDEKKSFLRARPY